MILKVCECSLKISFINSNWHKVSNRMENGFWQLNRKPFPLTKQNKVYFIKEQKFCLNTEHLKNSVFSQFAETTKIGSVVIFKVRHKLHFTQQKRLRKYSFFILQNIFQSSWIFPSKFYWQSVSKNCHSCRLTKKLKIYWKKKIFCKRVLPLYSFFIFMLRFFLTNKCKVYQKSNLHLQWFEIHFYNFFQFFYFPWDIKLQH